MKQILFAITMIAISITACQKQAITPAPTHETVSADDQLPTDAKFFYNTTPVTRKSEIKCYDSDQRVVLATDKINGTPSYYFFDNADAAEAFIGQYPVMRELQIKARQCREMRAYATAHGEYERYAQTGSFSDEFITYTQQFKSQSRGFALLYQNIMFGGAFMQLNSAFPIALFPAFINNNGESIRPPAGAVIANTLWDGPGFGAPGIFINMSLPNFVAIGFVNKFSSAN